MRNNSNLDCKLSLNQLSSNSFSLVVHQYLYLLLYSSVVLFNLFHLANQGFRAKRSTVLMPTITVVTTQQLTPIVGYDTLLKMPQYETFCETIHHKLQWEIRFLIKEEKYYSWLQNNMNLGLLTETVYKLLQIYSRYRKTS